MSNIIKNRKFSTEFRKKEFLSVNLTEIESKRKYFILTIRLLFLNEESGTQDFTLGTFILPLSHMAVLDKILNSTITDRLILENRNF